MRTQLSVTQIASSTTEPMTRISANIDKVLMLMPNMRMKMKVPISDTGIVTDGMIVARQSCRNTHVIATTRMKVSTSVKTISYSAFKNCPKLTLVQGSFGVETIEVSAFKDCTALSNIVLSENLESIQKYAFYNCTSLESITLKGNVNNIESYAFEGCENLTEIVFEGTVAQWNAITKGSEWDYGCGVTVIKCADGNIINQ